MDNENIDELIEIVAKASSSGESQRMIIKRLTDKGVTARKAYHTIQVVARGYRAGEKDVLTGSRSSRRIRLGHDPVFDAAFKAGKEKQQGFILTLLKRNKKGAIGVAALVALIAMVLMLT